MPSVEELLEEVIQPKGCKVRHIVDPKARKFVEEITKAKQAGKDPNIERSSELLEEVWNIRIPRRSLSEHARGKCSCPKTK
jgi:hypothetical protein